MKIIVLVLIGLYSQNCIAQVKLRLEGTEYSLSFPDSYKAERVIGVDYMLFRFSQKVITDSSNAFLMYGCCVGLIGDGLPNVKIIDSVNEMIMGNEARWIIYDWNSKYFSEAIIPIADNEKMIFGIKSKRRDELDRIIKAFGTLSNGK